MSSGRSASVKRLPNEKRCLKSRVTERGDVTRLTLYEYAATVRRRYGRARKKEKGRILDEFCQTTGLHRKAAIRLLRTSPPGQ
jgi:hypothetical protein